MPILKTSDQDIIRICKDKFHFEPNAVQIQVTTRIGLCQHTILIAGCGWGKSLVFFLPLLVWPDSIILVLSPLKALAQEQARKLSAVGVESISLSSDTVLTNEIKEKLYAGEYQAIFISPELIFLSYRHKRIWESPHVKSRLQAIVIDEAHCIHTWKKFRPHYDNIGVLRGRFSKAPIIALSATLPREILATVKQSLDLNSDFDVQVINTGNDRINIKYIVRRFRHSVESFKDLDFLLSNLQKTIVYFDSLDQLEDAFTYLRNAAGSDREDKIASYHAIKSIEYRTQVMDDFKSGKILILLGSEAVGMGCDIPDVARVVQYGMPQNLVTLVQRLGRAARDPTLKGHGILFITANSMRNDGKAEKILLEYVCAQGCRRKVLNSYFDNEHKIVPDCCDLCNPDITAAPWAPRFISNDGVSTKRQIGLSFNPSEKKRLRGILLEWRKEAFKKSLRLMSSFFPEECVMPDDIMEKCLNNAGKILLEPRLVRSILGWCPAVEDHPDEVVDILHKFAPSTRPAPPDFTQPEEIDHSETPYQATNYLSTLLSGKTPFQAASSPSTLPSSENSFHIVNFPPTLPPNGNPSQASSSSSTLLPNVVLTDVMDVDKPILPDVEGLPKPPSLGPAKRVHTKKNADKGPPKKIRFAECSTSSTFQKKNLYR